jgi:hypothetical protein
VDNHQVKANFWDLAGAAEYFEVRNEFYRDAQGAMLGTSSGFSMLQHFACLTRCLWWDDGFDCSKILRYVHSTLLASAKFDI